MTHYAAAVQALEHSVTGEGNFVTSIYLLVWGLESGAQWRAENGAMRIDLSHVRWANTAAGAGVVSVCTSYPQSLLM